MRTLKSTAARTLGLCLTALCLLSCQEKWHEQSGANTPAVADTASVASTDGAANAAARTPSSQAGRNRQKRAKRPKGAFSSVTFYEGIENRKRFYQTAVEYPYSDVAHDIVFEETGRVVLLGLRDSLAFEQGEYDLGSDGIWQLGDRNDDRYYQIEVIEEYRFQFRAVSGEETGKWERFVYNHDGLSDLAGYIIDQIFDSHAQLGEADIVFARDGQVKNAGVYDTYRLILDPQEVRRDVVALHDKEADAMRRFHWKYVLGVGVVLSPQYDSRVNGAFALRDPQSVQGALGEGFADRVIFGGEGSYPYLEVRNHEGEGSEYLRLYKTPDDTQTGSFSVLEVGYVPDGAPTDPKTVFLSIFESFKTESGVKLGMKRRKIEGLRGKSTEVETQNGITRLSYRQQGGYVAQYYFNNSNELIRFRFGYFPKEG